MHGLQGSSRLTWLTFKVQCKGLGVHMLCNSHMQTHHTSGVTWVYFEAATAPALLLSALRLRLHRWLSAKGQAVVRRPHAEVSLPGAAGEVLHHQVLRLQPPTWRIASHILVKRSWAYTCIIDTAHQGGRLLRAKNCRALVPGM